MLNCLIRLLSLPDKKETWQFKSQITLAGPDPLYFLDFLFTCHLSEVGPDIHTAFKQNLFENRHANTKTQIFRP
jgi:hypothetical protein